MDPLEQLTRRIEVLEAEAAIVRLSADYCHGADLRDVDLFLSAWTAAAVWQVSEDVASVGLDEIRAGIEQQWSTTTRAFHWTSNPAIDVGTDLLRAQGRFDVHTQVELVDGTWLALAGTYRDDYVRLPEGWRIARRSASVHSQRAL